MVALAFVLIWTMNVLVSGMELRRRKNVAAEHGDDEEEDSGSSKSVDETEVRQSKRKKKQDAESSEESGPHKCRFCKKSFKQSQALGGHMNCHRQEKDREAFEKAERLLASNSPYAANNPWNMQGHPSYNYGGPGLMPNPQAGPPRPFYDVPNQAPSSSLQNSQIMNHNVPNGHFQQPPMQQQQQQQPGGGGYYNPMDNAGVHYNNPMPPQRNNFMSPPAQFQGQQASPHVYSNSKRLAMHGHGLDALQSQGQSSVFHNSNIQGPDTLLDMMDTPGNCESFIRQAAFYRQVNQVHIVDQRGNLAADFPPAQIVLQDNYKPPHVPDSSQDGSSTLMDPLQAGIGPDTSVDNSGKLL